MNAENEKQLVEIAQKKQERGLPLTSDERSALAITHAHEEANEILAAMDEVRNKNDRTALYTQGNFRSVRAAVRMLVGVIYGMSAAHAEKRQILEERVKQLHARIIELEERSPAVQGTFDPKKTYSALDVVALNGASFTAKRNNPGPCPGDGWQLSAQQGKRGKPGPRVTSLSVDGQGMLTLVNGDGSTVKCDLYPLLAKLK